MSEEKPAQIGATSDAAAEPTTEEVMPGINNTLAEHVANLNSAVIGRLLKSQKSENCNDPSLRFKRRLKLELDDILAHPPPYSLVSIKAMDLYHWVAVINGPIGTAYEGGHFRLDIQFTDSYPFQSPQIRFMTRVYHCNVDSDGAICLDLLKHRWSPVYCVSKILLSIYVLMIECNPDDPMVSFIADMYKTDRSEHDRIARFWTDRFAKPEEQEQKEEKA